MFFRIYFFGRNDVFDYPVFVDYKGGAKHAHVGFAVEFLFTPGAELF